MSRVDASRHLNILLNADLFTGQEVGENAKLLLKFVRHAEKIASHANSVRYGAFASARDPGAGYGGIQSAKLNGKTSFTTFGEQPWATAFDPTLPTSHQTLGKIYKKHGMKPMRRSLQAKKDPPFGGRGQVGSDVQPDNLAFLPNVLSRGPNVHVIDIQSEFATHADSWLAAS